MPAARRSIVGVFAALLVLALTPTVAQAATAPCPASDKYAPLGLNGVKKAVTPSPTPAVGHDVTGEPYREEAVTRSFYRLDLSGSPTKPDAALGDVTIRLTWDNRTDFDMYVYDGAGSELGESVSSNFVSGVGRETVGVPALSHCQDLRIDVVNYLGLPTSALQLEITVANLA
jgi:hypothetical protein